VTEKELEPWDGAGMNGDDITLEVSGDAVSVFILLLFTVVTERTFCWACSNDDILFQNGWDAHDMFRKNEQVYGVQTNFDQNLSGYTIQLQKSDSKEYK